MGDSPTVLRQLWALTAKNWIVLRRHWIINLLRCLFLPLAYGLFVSLAQLFLIKPNILGIGDPVPVLPLNQALPSDGSLTLIYAINPAVNSTLPEQIIQRVLQSLEPGQRDHVIRIDTPDAIVPRCKQNFNGFSECFAAAIFNNVSDNEVDYTIRADAGLFFIDVKKHRSDFERRVLPLQWAIDEAIISLTANASPPAPLEWPFTNESPEDQNLRIRLSFLSAIESLFVLALLVAFLGVPYHLPGSYVTERASGVTSLMATMGCNVVARYLSFHLAITLAYLPAWIIVGAFFHFRIFTSTPLGTVIAIHVLLGLILAVYSLFLALPFASSPSLASIIATFATIILAVGALILSTQRSNTTAASCIYTIIFPPGFYIFAIRALVGWERAFEGTKLGSQQISTPDPASSLLLGALIGVAVAIILVYPAITIYLETLIYEPVKISKLTVQSNRDTDPTSEEVGRAAIKIQGLAKLFKPLLSFGKGSHVTAIENLTLDIPLHGIFVLLGSNGAGKSTLMSVLIGKTAATSGRIQYLVPTSNPIGVVPQKNVFIDELTCLQTVRLFCVLKGVPRPDVNRSADQLLVDVGLTEKRDALVTSLSGGMKRKLQLSLGLAGNSDYIFIDECTSGVDPLSRRSLWRTIMSYRDKKTVVFTTHFLDEADLLADSLAVLGIPGKLRASGTPVSLKTSLETGYTVHVAFSSDTIQGEESRELSLLALLREVAPRTTMVEEHASGLTVYTLYTSDLGNVAGALDVVERSKISLSISNYDIYGPNLDEVFRRLMDDSQDNTKAVAGDPDEAESLPKPSLQLGKGVTPSILSQIGTVFWKRVLIFRRAWLSPVIMLSVAIAGSCVPLFFMDGRNQTCTTRFEFSIDTSLYLPRSPLLFIPGMINQTSPLLVAPAVIAAALGSAAGILPIKGLQDNATFVSTIRSDYQKITFGGISVDPTSLSSLVGWEASAPSLTGPTLLNLVDNLLWNIALNVSGAAAGAPRLIEAHYTPFPAIAATGLFALKWMAFYGAAMGAFPAFFALYIARERRTDIQSMQYSNGLSHPLALWLGHLSFDAIFCVIIATVTTVVFATVSDQFYGLGLLWLVTVFYGLAGALLAYVIAYLTRSPLASFAIIAGCQVLIFILYLAGYLLTLTYARSSDSNRIINIMHYTVSLAAPVASMLRAALVSVNLFNLLCRDNVLSTKNLGAISKFGGPLVYLIFTCIIFLTILVLMDTGLSIFKFRTLFKRGSKEAPDLSSEKKSERALQVDNVSKKFRKAKTNAVSDVSFSVDRGTVFALLGPNGAGKTTLFNMIRGEIRPTRGDVMIDKFSITRDPRMARSSLGVCPQFTAIDSELTVREHLLIYGRLKGLSKARLREDVEHLLRATDLMPYGDRLAPQLSGGNQRKLALAICLIGDPSLILVDEFSTGIDPRTKREMWATFARVSKGKALVMTTHSMEEAAVMADRIGIMASTLLVVGTVEDLIAQHGTYQVHFSTRSGEDLDRAKVLMSKIAGSRMMDDVATRFEVKVDGNTSIASLFHTLHEHGGDGQYTVERGNLESIFLRAIREHQVREE